MKIEIKNVSGVGRNATIYENGQMIPGIIEALISLRPNRLPILITEELVLDSSERPMPDGSGEHVKTVFKIYYPGEFVMEA